MNQPFSERTRSLRQFRSLASLRSPSCTPSSARPRCASRPWRGRWKRSRAKIENWRKSATNSSPKSENREWRTFRVKDISKLHRLRRSIPAFQIKFVFSNVFRLALNRSYFYFKLYFIRWRFSTLEIIIVLIFRRKFLYALLDAQKKMALR